MSFGAISTHVELLVALSAASSVFLAILVVAWPYLTRDQLKARMAEVANERERIRLRERARLNQSKKQVTLRSEPRKFYQAIVERFNLVKQAEDAELMQKLRMAGYRGQGPAITFVAARLIAPAVLLAIAGFYVFLVLQLKHPLFVKLGIVLAVASLGYYAPLIYVKNRITKRQRAIRRAWPDTLDLLLICVESGMGIESAFRRVSEEIGSQSAELAEELSLTTAELAYLQDRRKAYENLGERTGLDGVRGVVTSLIQSEKYGTPLGQSLRVLAQENRDMRMSEAEKKAAALPPKLTVPMILFFLPVLFAVIITPAIIQVAKLS
ncbi:type II secretion system F family protein [Microvirga makkahensis]|uniref:Type II secretion system F family protein n=1 Tax=Microvirga makkahensis TaxID=1128670 RepID=A0A7X3SN45_9HYPH|nr:type II secretion system F family protein [Microvirga makkahensis]MXQ10684.1 type II secretion system F family protein [Microvirga makkahensis]